MHAALGIGHLQGLSRPLNVLIVDSLESLRKLTANQMREFGARSVQVARDGGEAWKLLRSQSFDLVISDLELPVANGLQLLRGVRSDASLQNLPFLMLTASAERAQIERAIQGGVSAILLKPYASQQLLEHVERALRWAARRAGAGTPGAAATLAPTTPMTTAAAPPPRGEAVAEAIEEAGDERHSLLVVDDTADNLLLLSHLFRDEYRVRLAVNALKALDVCQSGKPPDLILLDVMMPGMDGFELARLLRERADTEHIPIIFVTALDGAADRLKGLDLGAVDFITKPIEPEVLKPKVRNFMRLLGQRRELQAQIDAALETAGEHEHQLAALRQTLAEASQQARALGGGAQALMQTLARAEQQLAAAHAGQDAALPPA